MNVKRIRDELEAIREALSAPVPGQQIGAYTDINARLDRLSARQSEPPGLPTTAEIARLASWWRERFGMELHG